MPEAPTILSADLARCWASIFAHSGELVFMMDAGRRIVAVSDGFKQRFEVSDEVLGHVCAAVAHKGGGIPEQCPFHELLLDGAQHVAEVHSDLLGGDFLVRVTPLKDERGQVAYAIHSLVDISERRRSEVALEDSAARFRGYFEQSLVGAAVTSPDKGWIEVNQATCDLLGYTSAELMRLTWADLTHPDDLAADVAQFERARAGEIDGYRLEKRFIRKNGAVVDVDMSVHCQRSPEGGLEYFLALLSDVTERKRLVDELNDEHQRFRLLVENSDEAFLLSQPDGAIHFASPEACRMLGRTEEEIRRIGRDGIVDASDPRLDALLETRARTGRYTGELRFVRADGSAFPGEISTSVYVDHAGETRTSMVIRDLSERKAAEAKIQALNAGLEARIARRTAQLEATNRELEAFAYSVSHDLRAPLRAIDGFSAVLAEDAGARLTPLEAKHLERIRAAAQRMGELIDDLLGLSRAASQDLVLTSVDVSGLAEGILADLREAQPSRRVETVVAPLMRASADPTLLRVILVNLLENAWKFTSRHKQARIEVGLQESDGERDFFVRDDGAGFDPAYSRNLFAAFQRMHAPGEFEGTGIGLATVQRLVARHGGRVWADAEVEEGATFYFTLPGPPA
jgi:PAS domain S-box-containing protein